MNDTQNSGYTMQSLFPSFAPSFLEDHARRIIGNPKIALTELVANSWDAGADRVEINWPQVARPETIRILDNGTGMTYDEFTERWPQLNYNRKMMQGEDVQFPPGNQPSHRKAFGRNGKGRHSMFCFADSYQVDTRKNGRGNVFEVRRTSSIARMPYDIQHLSEYQADEHGTTISAELGRNPLSIADVRDLIGSKFITDPTFKVYLNGDLVELTNLEHLIDARTVVIKNIGTVRVSRVDTRKTSRTSHLHGVAWWVNRRLVGEPSWKDYVDSGYLDRRTAEAKRYTFVVEADVLAEDVEEDWSEFRNTARFRTVRAAVDGHIRQRLAELMSDVHKARKKAALEIYREDLAELPPDSRYFVGQVIDGIQQRLPSAKPQVLSATVGVLTNLEKTRSGYALLERLAELSTDELDDLNDILAQWSVQEVRIVLGELDKRLKLIQRLEQLVEDPNSDELHDIHPLFARGLWIFGYEYESVHFSSNQTLLS